MHLLLASVSSAIAPSGVCRHAANLARGIAAHPAVSRVTLLVGEWQASYFRDAFGLNDMGLDIRPVAIANTPVARNLWCLRGLPAVAREREADVVHLAFPMPVLRSAHAAPVVASVHDLYPFDMPSNFGRKAWLNRAATRLCLHNVDAVACVSEGTRSRLHELFPLLAPQKTSVIPNAVYLSNPDERASLPPELEDFPFLLCVAQHRANKNLPLLLQAFQLALGRKDLPREMKLVLVGNEGPETRAILSVVAEYRLGPRIVLMSGISDGLLASLYARCELVVAPSVLEGFGLPVAEALAASCRVVGSDIPAFRALASTGCVFFDPTDTTGESLATAFRKVLSMPRPTLSSSSTLDPRQVAGMYLALYSRLLSSRLMRHDASSTVDLSLPGDL